MTRPDLRKREIQRIHILKGQLGLDDETYRAVLWSVATADSSTRLDAHGRTAVIQHLEGLFARTGKPYPKRPHNTDAAQRRELKKIEALLADAAKPWAYAEGMARHMYQKQRLAFCAPHELRGILAALERAALKRLKDELGVELQRLGLDWHFAGTAAALLFGFDAMHRTLDCYTETMSQVLRWLRGELAPVCERPVDLGNPQCCAACYRAAQIHAMNAGQA